MHSIDDWTSDNILKSNEDFSRKENNALETEVMLFDEAFTSCVVLILYETVKVVFVGEIPNLSENISFDGSKLSSLM